MPRAKFPPLRSSGPTRMVSGNHWCRSFGHSCRSSLSLVGTRWKPNIKWTKDRGKEPERPKAEYPWFWGWDNASDDEKSGKRPFGGGQKFDGNRHNDCHYTNIAKHVARDAGKGKS